MLCGNISSAIVPPIALIEPMCLLWTLVCFVISLFVCGTLKALPKGKPKGAVVTLIKGIRENHYSELLKRNKSIYKYLWKNNSAIASTGPNPDIVLFYESISAKMKNYIQSATPQMPIKFVPIQFTGFGNFESKQAKLVNPSCPPNVESKNFGIGYKNMCRFWFMGFLEYVKEYDWVFRLDSDCELVTDVTTVMSDQETLRGDSASHQRHTIVSAPAWMNLLHDVNDGISRNTDGDMVKGLGQFVREFASRKGLGKHAIDSWYAPYTNAVFFNTKWFRAHQTMGFSDAGSKISQQEIVRQFMKEVDDSNCIYSNRW